jgi:hypothetical protein
MHACGHRCECRSDLNNAAAGLAEAARMLAESVSTGNDLLIDTHYAFFRAAKSKFCGARAAHLDHRGEAALAAGTPPIAA